MVSIVHKKALFHSVKKCIDFKLDCKRITLLIILGVTFVCICIFSYNLNSNVQLYKVNYFKPKPSDLLNTAVSSTLKDINGTYSVEDEEIYITQDSLDNSDKSLSDFRQTSGCHIPYLNPYDSSIMEFMTAPAPINCTKTYPFLFDTDFYNKVIKVRRTEDFGWTDCCYRSLIRRNISDNSVSLSIDCFPLQNTTEIPPEHEFIAITCTSMQKPIRTKILDILAFVPPKKVTNTYKHSGSQDRLNVLILGLDGLSHMNFIRVMSKSHKYLRTNLSAYEMHGYTKVGDNTYPNIVPVLTSLMEDELFQECLQEARPFYDKCPYIWKNFSDHGFRTSFAEDAPWIGIFNYEKKGFKYSPVDYYIRPMTYFQEKMIGSNRALNVDYCYGPRLTLKILLDYSQKMAVRMKESREKYFQFVWATALFHDSLTDGKHGDEVILSTLKWFNENNYLNDTVLIVMSDHGVRFGGIRYTYQGKIEERMPLLYIVLPKWFQDKYTSAAMNLKENQKKLTTPFDLHETLKDLLNPYENMQENVIRKRITNLKNEIPRGISLFLPIPPQRDCEMASIDDHWCICQKVHSLDLKIKQNIQLAKQAASTAVYFINKLLEPFNECAFLSLTSILNAQIIHAASSILNSNDTETNFGITFLTDPGNGTFEATVNINEDGKWNLEGDVSRINLYGNQSHCVHSYKIKKYCYCLDLLISSDMISVLNYDYK